MTPCTTNAGEIISPGAKRSGFFTRAARSAVASHAILTITDDGNGYALVTTAAPHGLSDGVAYGVEITGDSVEGYNTSHSISETPGGVPSPTTFITDQPYTSDGTGGTWALA